MPTRPGTIHRVTAVANAMSVLRSLTERPPILARSAATYSATPSSFLTSGLLSSSSTTARATNIARQMGSAAMNHSAKVIVSPVASSMSPRPMRFGGEPIGVSSPPTPAP